MESVIQELSWQKLVNLLEFAQKRIVIIMPAIHDEWIDVIMRLNKTRGLELWVCIDNNEQVFRAGYGDMNAIAQLQYLEATINQCKDLRLGFLGIDELGWSFHFESRIISGNPEGPNAILLTEETSNNIIQTFFPEKFKDYEHIKDELPIEPLDQIELNEISERLEKNPPTLPDNQREINTYITLFQFAELHFEGGKLATKTISIPSKALPFKDSDLKERLKTKLNLFSKEKAKEWNELEEIQSKVDAIRVKYLVSCVLRKEKSILRKGQKELFQKEVNDLKSTCC